MRIAEQLDGTALHQWFEPETDQERVLLKQRIYRSLVDQNDMPLSESDFMDSCSYAGSGVFVYTVPLNSETIHICLSIQGTINTKAVEPPRSWHA